MASIPDDIRNQLSPAQRGKLQRIPQDVADRYYDAIRSQGFGTATQQYSQELVNAYNATLPKKEKAPGVAEQLGVSAAGQLATAAAGAAGKEIYQGVAGLFGSGGAGAAAGGGTAAGGAVAGGGAAAGTGAGVGAASGTGAGAASGYGTMAAGHGASPGAIAMAEGHGAGAAYTGGTSGGGGAGAGAANLAYGAAGAALAAGGAYGLYDTIAEGGQTNASASDAAINGAQGAISGAALVLGASVVAAAATTGATAGSFVPGIGTAIGALVGAAIGVAAAHFGSGKDERQQMRDKIREGYANLGLIDSELNYAGFNLDQDGGKQIGSDGRRIYELVAGQEKEGADPFAGPNGKVRGEIVAHLDPLNTIIAGGMNEAQGYSVAMMYNMIVEGGDIQGDATREQVYDLYLQAFGSDRNNAIQRVNALVEDGSIDQDRGAAYINSINTVYDNMENGVTGAYGLDPNAPVEQRPAEEQQAIMSGDVSRATELAINRLGQEGGFSNLPGAQSQADAQGMLSPPPSEQQPQVDMTMNAMPDRTVGGQVQADFGMASPPPRTVVQDPTDELRRKYGIR